MKLDAQIRLNVEALDQEGAGVASAADVPGAREALEIHVAGALPGEDISAQVDGVSTHRPVAWATLRTLHRRSPDRVPSTCAAHGRCGGCVLQHLDIGAQRRWKELWLRQLVAAEPAVAEASLHPMIASPRSVGYRNNAKLVPTLDGAGRLILGAYARRSHDVIDLAGCTVTEPALESAAGALRDILQTEGVVPYDEIKLTGLLRYVVLRANAVGQVLVTLVTATDFFPEGGRVAASLRARLPAVLGVVQNINPTRGNTIHGAHERPLAGAASIEDRIGGVRLRLSSRAFFQANREVAGAAYAAIVRAVSPTSSDRVIDAYAGVGGIALTLAPCVRSVVGIEEHPGAVDDATASAALNGITNARFVAGDVAARLGAIDAAEIVVLNPPRKGCALQVLDHIVRLRPRVIAYLSCAPDTLLRDRAILAARGYRTVSLTPFDMLPHTPHIETLAILSRP